jgi:D-alanyl-D-alanine carboxypeptidase/D-alanyl-D-alanine-endopeptidase (penicillin-binding protein 4)
MQGTPAAGRILAKTGTLRQVNALAGYAETRSGERLAFAILVNHHAAPGREVTAAIDAICNLLVE